MDFSVILNFIFIVIILFLLIKVRALRKTNQSQKKTEPADEILTLNSPKSFEAILKSIKDGLIIVDPKGHILLTNQSFRDMIRAKDAPEGKHFIEVVRNIDLLNLLKEAISTKDGVAEEITITRGNEEMHLIAKSMPILDSEGNISFLIVLLNDITKLKKLENMRRDFVANVSHELKTPVTAIKGYAEALLDGALDDRENAAKFIEIIKVQSDRLNALIEDILTLSRIESGDIKIEKEVVNLDEIVSSVFQIFADKAQKKGISLEREIDQTITVFADRNRLTQILINLVDNGIKFTERGYVKVRLYRENGSPILSVEDTGIGIPKEHLPRIGERFYRVDKARSRQLGGTGLGLAIVKHLVMAHGWQFSIESEPGFGTKVKVKITDEV